MEIEFKTFEFEVKEAKDDGTEAKIEGYASTFGNIDFGLDRVMKGAFKKTLQESKGRVPILADHNPYEQIGWNEKAAEDTTGLNVEGSLILGVQKAKERYLLAKKALQLKARAGLSIGYMTIKAEPDSEQPRVRNLVELKLFEYSLVTFPMNAEAMVTAAKSIGEVDKAKFLLSQLVNQGISLHDLGVALAEQAAKHDEDPTKISQSLDNLIEKFKKG